MRLGSKIALVTGAGGGLGGATAIRFATEGAKVVCSDIDLAKAEKTVSMIESRGGTAIAYQCDIADPAQCNAQVEEAITCFGRLDVLVNSAGVSLHRLALDTTIEDWNRVLNINLTGSFLTAQAAANVMLKRGGGRIIQIGSI
ncbi:MAG: SDR family oxidoreductase, partial [Pseudomonadota bacterium]|nr:SDR family oxidoreductase [Pseudomonadota bacterium]